MSAIDSYKSYNKEIEKSQDQDGDYILYEKHYQMPCNCHPETYSCSGKTWHVLKFKKYENGIIIQL